MRRDGIASKLPVVAEDEQRFSVFTVAENEQRFSVFVFFFASFWILFFRLPDGLEHAIMICVYMKLE